MQVKAGALQKGGGSGLGLWGKHSYSALDCLQFVTFPSLCAVANSIMEAHGGSIGVFSEGEDSGGSVFYIDIPVSDQADFESAKSLSLTGQSSKRGGDAADHPSPRSNGGSAKGEWNAKGDTFQDQLAKGFDVRVKFDDGSTKDGPIMPPPPPPHEDSTRTLKSIDELGHTTSSTSSRPVSAKRRTSFGSLSIVSGQTILIVDDSPSIRKMAARLLRDMNADNTVDHASDGKVAVEKIERLVRDNKREYDVIMMDYMVSSHGLIISVAYISHLCMSYICCRCLTWAEPMRLASYDN